MQPELARAEHSHIWVREPGEYYVEPEWCSRRLFEQERFEGQIHDPACGFGRIVISALRAGYVAAGSDLVDRGWDSSLTPHDFLASTYRRDNIVSNPPFDIFKDFALRALELARRKVALIWLVRTLPAAGWLEDTPLARILFLTPRPSMPPGHIIARGEKPGGGKQDFCWLIWDRSHVGPATAGWLRRDG